MLKIAIVGRPNVGKSTLFNRLTKNHLSITSDKPGTTRDYREYDASIADIEFTLTDLAGYDFSSKDDLGLRINKTINQCIENSDLIIMMFDALNGITSEDQKFSKLIKKINKPTILLGNKSEKKKLDFLVTEGWSLGFGQPIPFSSLHGKGIEELYERIKEYFIKLKMDYGGIAKEKLKNINSPIKLAFVGKPNSGKSTMINRILGYDRMITGSESGTTHDSIEIDFVWNEKEYQLIDTGGMRKKSKVLDDLEFKVVGSSLRSIKYANIVILMIDGTKQLNKQDLSIARWVIEEGRALILCLSKWDIISNKQETFNSVVHRIKRSLPDMRKTPIVKSSGLLGLGIDELMNLSENLYSKWNARIQTSILNDWFQNVIEIHPPPLKKGKRIKLQYISQIKSRPPTFIIFSNIPESLPDSYIRYIISKLRENFNFFGIPIRIITRKKKNPYLN